MSAAAEDALLDALDEASAAQLIRAQAGASSAGDDMFAFTHDKIREVLYEELNPIRRRRLHQRVGETLEKLYGIDGSAKATSSGDGVSPAATAASSGSVVGKEARTSRADAGRFAGSIARHRSIFS